MREAYQPANGVPNPSKGRNTLPPLVLTALGNLQTTEVCPSGHEFFMEGQSPQGIYILYSGRVELSVTDAHGRQMVMGTAVPGDVLGLSAALSGKFYEETAVAALTCRTGFVRCSDFLQFLDHYPEAAFWVVQLMSDRVTTTLDQLSGIHGPQIRSLRQ